MICLLVMTTPPQILSLPSIIAPMALTDQSEESIKILDQSEDSIYLQLSSWQSWYQLLLNSQHSPSPCHECRLCVHRCTSHISHPSRIKKMSQFDQPTISSTNRLLDIINLSLTPVPLFVLICLPFPTVFLIPLTFPSYS